MKKKVEAQVVEQKQTKQVRTKKIEKKSVKKDSSRLVPTLAITLFALLFGVSLFQLFRQSQRAVDQIIVTDLYHLKKIMEQIDQECGIIDFEHIKNYIDFLTVKEFVGSEVGAMNLKRADQWKGPYLQDNPTIQEQQYVVLHNKDGYFIVPGDGVVLGNKKTIGKDIVLNEATDMKKILDDEQGLKSQAGSLGVKLDIGQSRLHQMLQQPVGFVE